MHTFASIYLHVVFATWSRQPYLTHDRRPSLHAYLASSARHLGVANVHVGGHEDHIHLLGRFDPAHSISEAVGRIKGTSSGWMKDQGCPRFRWQRGYGAFSVSINRVASVVRYVKNQEEHHKRVSFADEIEALLREQGADPASFHLL
jgi:putative transposase